MRLQGHKANKGIFITTLRFTDDARNCVARIGSKIVPIDGEQLAQLMIDHDVGVYTISVYPMKKIDSDYFNEVEVLPGARSIVVAGFRVAYEPRLIPSEPGRPRGRFTPYGSRVFAPMTDYCRRTIRDLLRQWGFEAAPSMKIPVKMAAARAGLGKYGKNAVLQTEKFGSWVMFECLVTGGPWCLRMRPFGKRHPCKEAVA